MDGKNWKTLDAAYEAAVQAGDMDLCRRVVQECAEQAGILDKALPAETDAYNVRTKPAPKRTVKACKIFYVDAQGRPSALFAGGCAPLPAGIWIDAKDQWSFKAPNGRRYIPGCRNPNRTRPDGSPKNRAGGSPVPMPADPAERQVLQERGFAGPGASSVKALAHRPGWHAGLLPYFPQGGKRALGTPYGNVHEWNQVVYEVLLSADRDWTDFARSQERARTKDGRVCLREADLDFLPEGGFYHYATNPLLDARDGSWLIADSMCIVRPLSQDECDAMLVCRGMPPQAWEQGIMRLEDLNVPPGPCAPSPVLAPIAFGANGRLVPLSERFTELSCEAALHETNEDEEQRPAP